jgi:hypothetical protein
MFGFGKVWRMQKTPVRTSLKAGLTDRSGSYQDDLAFYLVCLVALRE